MANPGRVMGCFSEESPVHLTGVGAGQYSLMQVICSEHIH